MLYHPRSNMAKVWKQILKQESEHQWLAIGVFFVFIILGAMMIKGTSFLPGIDLLDNEIGEDFRILESTYIDENENEKLDTNFFGIPKEQYGFSNNTKAFGIPKFEAAAFAIDTYKKVKIGL